MSHVADPAIRGARLSAFAQAFGTARGERFLMRMAGQTVPHLGLSTAMPVWLVRHSDADRDTLGVMMALLHYRPQIDRELSGLRLGLIAAELGETLVDAACSLACPPPALCAPPSLVLPRPDQIRERGAALLRTAIPIDLASRFEGAQGDPAMAALATLAFAQCNDSDLWIRSIAA